MKKIRTKGAAAMVFLSAIAILLLLPAVLADETTDFVFMPHEITVGRGEYVRIFYSPRLYTVNISCDDPSAMRDIGMGSYFDVWEQEHRYRKISMLNNGTYTLTVTDNADNSYVIIVTVVDPPTSITVAQSDYCVVVGQTIDLGLDIAGGVLYDSPYQSQTALYGSFSSDYGSFTGVKPGYQTFNLKLGIMSMGSFNILVVEETENVKLSADNDRSAMGYRLPFRVTDGSGNEVIARVEITEGSECATYHRNGTWCFLDPIQPGLVTITAYGTDGSTDSLTIRIYPAPESFTADVPSDTIAAGEKMQISVTMPEGYWYPPSFYIHDQTPSDPEINGPVASVSDDGVITGLMPGTCTLQVSCGSLKYEFDLCVTDSDGSLVITRPTYYFPWTEQFQLSVDTKDGRNIPAVFKSSNSGFNIDMNGVLTAAEPNRSAKISVITGEGYTYSFSIQSVEVPTVLIPDKEELILPLNVSTMFFWECHITSDVEVREQDLVLCSGDESILTINDTTLVPYKKTGSTVLTVWSRYGDAHCEIPVTVTEPTDTLYVDGKTSLMMAVPSNTYTNLPVVTDYYGNPVSVKWSITSESSGSGSAHCVQLQNNQRIKCLSGGGSAVLTAVSVKTGSTFKLSIFTYIRSEKCSLTPTETTIHTGETSYLYLHWPAGSNGAALERGDVSFTLTGDTDSVEMEDKFSNMMLKGLAPGTVRLTAKLYNGFTASAVVHVVIYPGCENGHDPIWSVVRNPDPSSNGVREQKCSRCGLELGSEVIPCTGVLSFSDSDYYVYLDGDDDTVWLGTTLDGDKKNSFTWTSSDPETVIVSANKVTGLKPGIAYITVTKGDCEPAVCCVHVVDRRELHFPSGLQIIEDEAFAGNICSYAVLPQGVKTIGSQAFAHCTRLKEIVIPESVFSIAEDAFMDCPQLTIRCSAGSYADEYAEAHGITTVH